MSAEKKERTVIHLELTSGEHHYFGSIANIYEYFSALRNYKLSSEKPYQNTKCIIRKGVLLSKEGNRGRKKEKSDETNRTNTA